MLIVAAIGGNALLRPGEPFDVETQRRNLKVACKAIAELAQDHQVVVTHGNGPQVGLLALQSDAYRDARANPLDVLDAETEGMIGYALEQELINALPRRDVATLLTQVVVDADDGAFQHPTKPIGPVYSEDEAARLATERGWAIAPDRDGWRRVVASPTPHEIVELDTIDLLIESEVVVICAGGGGIPVAFDDAGGVRGVEAVIDKDRSAALLARDLAADALLLLTDVPAVYAKWDTPEARPIRRISPRLLDHFEFPARSMRPKVEAASWFASPTGRSARIGALSDAAAILGGKAGTEITARAEQLEWYDASVLAGDRLVSPGFRLELIRKNSFDDSLGRADQRPRG
jgi:carbamate kinase